MADRATDLLATLAWALLVVGWTQRRARRRHVPLVLAGIALDVALVVHLEVARGVVETAVREHLSPVRWAHVATSLAAVLLYVPVVVLGVRLMRGAEVVRRAHRRLASLALMLRSAGLVFMWAS